MSEAKMTAEQLSILEIVEKPATWGAVSAAFEPSGMTLHALGLGGTRDRPQVRATFYGVDDQAAKEQGLKNLPENLKLLMPLENVVVVKHETVPQNTRLRAAIGTPAA